VAGDDALDARWVPLADLDRQALATSFGVADIARKAAALMAPRPPADAPTAA